MDGNGSPLAVARPESEALEDLKAKINDPQYPTVDLARTLERYHGACPQSDQSLADKLGMPGKRSYFSEVRCLLKLSPGELEKIEGVVLSRKTLRRLAHSVETGDKSGDNQRLAGDKTGDNADYRRWQTGDNSGDNQGQDGDKSGYPLIRDTINSLIRLVLFWNKEPDLGNIVERWLIRLGEIGWLRGLMWVALLGFAGYGFWQAQLNARPHIRHLWHVIQASDTSGAPGSAASVPPAPLIANQRWVSGHRLELRWPAVPAAVKYRVYRHSRDGGDVIRINDVTTPGARVSISAGWGPSLVSVTAINRDDEESAHSALIQFDPEPVNEIDNAQPLPLEGAAVPTSRASAGHPPRPLAGDPGSGLPAPRPAQAASLQPPSEVHADVKTPDLIRISWRAVSKDARYNVYSSASRALTNLRKENDNPVKSNVVEWIPETGLERYWITVTTLDADGRESAYSEAIEVVRHPEKSGSNGADEAAGFLRKILPW